MNLLKDILTEKYKNKGESIAEEKEKER